ncbi:MAG: molybdopterin-dependent oxidoreductase, partial [Actinobacteria bacterium]|nr:molybdopterin-dependent oxidoreductase [Actinomycetota bacterium]
CHPVGFHWPMEAKRRGAKLIHVDPRFTRTSAVADIHVPIRAGSDIAFLGGLVNYIITNDRYFTEYVVNYTNASAIVSDDFRDTEDLDGFFSGWNSGDGGYDVDTWQYQGFDVIPMPGQSGRFGTDHEGQTNRTDERRDETLQDPRCVFQILERHYSRYTPEMVEATCGIPANQFLAVAEALCDNSGRERTSAICYAVGWTQHSVGAQYIRAASIVQLLLGNIGRPGGGILALRGHASIQGSTDIPTLYNLLPGYMPMPKAEPHPDLSSYMDGNRAPSGWWSNFPKYFVSLLKAWYGDAASAANDYCYDYLPRLTGDHSHMTTVADMADGKLKGYFVMGENPTVGSMHGALHRKGLRELDWVVVRDFAVTETADFWQDAPEIKRGEIKTRDIKTEVFFFPCAAHTEKDGSFTNTQRLLQWHHAAVKPPGDARSELHFMYHLGRRLKDLYADSADPKDRALRSLTWDYPTKGDHDEPDAEAVLAEVNGYTVADGEPLGGFLDLADDGSTASGCWIYAGAYKDGANQTARRKAGRDQTWVAPEWGWAWPANRRILYNRASADPAGKPWSERKKFVWWNDDEGEWEGLDQVDFVAGRPPSYRPGDEAQGVDSLSGIDPFIMQGDGKGWLYAPNGLLDGPLPTHYEPQESITTNPLYGQQCNPARMEWRRRDNPFHKAHDDPRFPYVVTTYRLTEHHTAGAMSRWVAWLAELQPEMFCEVSPELARERGLSNGGWATITTARGEIEARVLVTGRLGSLRLKRRTVHQIGLPYHWGSKGLSTGDTVNELIGFVGDPNVSIQESKALTADIVAGRRSRGRRVVTSGDLVTRLEEDATERDLPGARDPAHASHGHKSGESTEGRSHQ